MKTCREDFAFVALLKDCAKKKDLHKGIRLHADVVKNGLLGKSVYLASTLINMYATCGMLAKAQEVLEKLHFRDVVTWNTLISGYVKHGQGHEALHCYEMMQSEGFSPVDVTYICILKACGKTCNIDKGIQIHEEIVSKGLLKKSVMLSNALVDMYIKFGMVEKAKTVLEELPVRDVVSWNALIAGYVQQGQGNEALNCYEKMQKEGFSPDSITFNCMLKVCGHIGSIEKGEQVHERIIRMGLLEKNLVLTNALVDMYAKCGMFTKAQQLLDELHDRNAISWNALIAGYIQKGQGIQALNCFERMQSEGFPGDAVTFICILKACGSIGGIDKGKQIHNEILSRKLLEKDIVLGTALVDMYGKCGMLAKAQQVLEDLPTRDIVSWNALITGYAQQEKGYDALNCFDQMLNEGLSPDVVTFICILKVCGNVGAIHKGKQIHEEVVSRGLLQRDIVLATALIDMYAKCGMLEKARELLEELPTRNVVSWNALISGYTQQGHGYEALSCFEKMQNDGLFPDDGTFQCVLCACGHSGLLDEAQLLFNDMTKKYGITPTLEHHTCLVEAFGFAGDFDKAVSMIKVMPSCDDISVWLGILGACRKWGNVKLGRLCFDQIVQLDGSCTSAYVLMANMFASSGMQEDAEKIEAMRMKYAPCKKSQGNSSWVDGIGNFHSFSPENYESKNMYV